MNYKLVMNYKPASFIDIHIGFKRFSLDHVDLSAMIECYIIYLSHLVLYIKECEFLYQFFIIRKYKYGRRDIEGL